MGNQHGIPVSKGTSSCDEVLNSVEEYKIHVRRDTGSSDDGSNILADGSLFTPTFLEPHMTGRSLSHDHRSIPDIKRRVRTVLSSEVIYENDSTTEIHASAHSPAQELQFDKEEVTMEPKVTGLKKIGALTKGLFPHHTSRKAQLIKALNAAEVIPEDVIVDILPFCQLEKFMPSDCIFSIGEPANSIFVIGNGKVSLEFPVISKPLAYGFKNEMDFVVRKGSGDFFGQSSCLAFMREWEKVHSAAMKNLMIERDLLEVKRVCSAFALTEVECVVIDVKALFRKFGSSAIQTMDFFLGGKIAEFLPSSQIMKDCRIDFSKHPGLLSMFTFKQLKAGDVLFTTGSGGKDLYVIKRGVLQVVMDENRAEKSAKMEVTLSRGAICGEMALLIDSPRDSSVICKKDALLLKLNAHEYSYLQEAYTEIASNISKLARKRLLGSLRKFQLPLFERFTEAQMEGLWEMSRIIQIPGGEIIFDVDEIGDSFYILVQGKIGFFVLKDNKMIEISRIGPGRYFGEMALITDSKKRLARAQSITKSVLLVISKSRFDIFFEKYPRALNVFQTKMSNYKLTFEDVLKFSKGREYLLKYCKSEHNEENLKFWVAASKFERVSKSMDRGELFLKFQDIYCDYIDMKSPNAINLPSKIRSSLCETTIVNVTSKAFVNAKEEIFRLMKEDVFRRFTASPLFQDLLNHLSAYSDEKSPL